MSEGGEKKNCSYEGKKWIKRKRERKGEKEGR